MVKRRSFVLAFWCLAASMMSSCLAVRAESFRPDTRIAAITLAYSEDAVGHARQFFGVELDGTEASLARLEPVLAALNASYRNPATRPNREELSTVAKGYGSYIGHVFVRHRDGEWGVGNLGKGDFSAIRTSRSMFWPVGYVEKRIRDGYGQSVQSYYRDMSR